MLAFSRLARLLAALVAAIAQAATAGRASRRLVGTVAVTVTSACALGRVVRLNFTTSEKGDGTYNSSVYNQFASQSDIHTI